MLIVSDGIDSKTSSDSCSQGYDFTSVSNTFQAISSFSTISFLSNSLNKKRTNGSSNLLGKKR